ncbi:MAG TPA: arginine repressor [Firmicutes bacterium]|jgi:transcriptional regulator of arginine metabolism|nr:arginine repressor [Bacillota bacterium]
MRQRLSKTKRHAKVLEIIRGKPIETQEDLAASLQEEGFEVTQATVSRDIKELGITKTPTGSGRYRYVVPKEKAFEDSRHRMRRLFQDSVISIDSSENLLVIRTLTGNAHAVAAVIDNTGIPEIVGTIAGDDTILIVVKPKSAVISVMERFNKLRLQSEE